MLVFLKTCDVPKHDNQILSYDNIWMSWSCQLRFVPRQANNVVDCLAKLGQNFGVQSVIFVDPPPEVAFPV